MFISAGVLALLGSVTLLQTTSAQRGYKGTASPHCRCLPSQSCWPTRDTWQALNRTLGGQLIHNEPVAISCYPGPQQSTSQCAYVDANWANNTFQQQYPVGYSYPLFEACPPVNVSAGGKPTGSCELGDAPVYTVNATELEHVVAGIAFAKKHNLRLVLRDTGHDLLGRSAGFGSLQIWIKYLRTGITFHETFKQPGSAWAGAAFTIGGGYTWSDVYPEAAKRDVIVVGGGTPSVGCLGGWMQGGGHSPATHDYGLGADNVLQAKVVLANGSLVTASPSQNADLFFAIRGGGPGTYGVVIETTVKAWPTTSVVAQTLAFAPLRSNDTDLFLEAVADIYQSFPSLAQADWSGYGTWCTACATPLFSNFTAAYTHSLANFRLSPPAAEAAFAPTLAKLQTLNGTALFVSVQYSTSPSYAAYYDQYSGGEPPAGTLGAQSSRFLDAPALLANRTALLATLRILAGAPSDSTTNVVEFFGAPPGRIARDGHVSPVSGVNPAWRSMEVQHLVARGWTQDTPAATIRDIQTDITTVKGAALKALAPDTGCYMNEADRLDPDYKKDFYGEHYGELSRIKAELDPEGTFYCPTCVGSEDWEEGADGRLCRVRKGW